MRLAPCVISPSSMARVLECPRKAKLSENINDTQAFPIGMHVGNIVHAAITGHKYEQPSRLAMDKITPTMRDAKIQAQFMIDRAEDFLANYKIIDKEVPVAREIDAWSDTWRVEGTIDLILERYQDGLTILCDLKTGYRRPSGVWPQLSAYAFAHGRLLNANEPNGTLIRRCAVLWVPRRRYRLNDVMPEWEERDFEHVYFAGQDMASATAVGLSLAHTVPSQQACASCTVEDCAVRWW